MASLTPLQALALKHNLLEKLSIYKEELQKKNNHAQLQLLEELGEELDARVARILVGIINAGPC